MKTLIKHLLSGLCLTLVSISAFARSETISLGKIDNGYGEEDMDPPNRGHRIPSPATTCTIDFDNHRIETSIPYEITAYELWDEDGIDTIVSYPSDYDIVELMSTVSGAFQLRLITVEYTYIGYLEL